MKTINIFYALLLTGGSFCASTAHAGQSQVTCQYSHTLGDDAIMMYGMPGQAMWHDFFGNTHTDAWSTYASLRAKPETTCDNQADGSAYWVPTMKLPNGEVVKPTYQKTYYQSHQDAANPLTPFPEGLELLAGNHHGSTPNSHITFLCANGKGYSNKAGEVCGLRAKGDAVQLNVGIAFPNCWDGLHLQPAHGQPNADYSVKGACPAAFPVKIPTVNLNVVWVLPQITTLDTAKIQLSLDPKMDGSTRLDRWGSIYTAHADFINGWTPDAARFMTERCMNNGMDCGTNIPWAYANASDDTYVDSQQSDANFSQQTQIITRGNSNTMTTSTPPQSLGLIKFTIPPLPKGLSASQLANFKYRLRIYGGRDENGADMIRFYPVNASGWTENSVTWNTRPARTSGTASLYLDQSHQYRYVDVTDAVKQALAKGETQIAWCISGDNADHTYRFNSAETAQGMILMLQSNVKVPEA